MMTSSKTTKMPFLLMNGGGILTSRKNNMIPNKEKSLYGVTLWMHSLEMMRQKKKKKKKNHFVFYWEIPGALFFVSCFLRPINSFWSFVFANSFLKQNNFSEKMQSQ